MQKKIVITGGPGTGKSAVIEALEKDDYSCMPEISRQITIEAQKTGISQLFLSDPLLFSEKVLQGRVEQFKQANLKQTPIVFFDRGIPDVHGYMNYLGVNYPNLYLDTSKVYQYTYVFIMPPWKEIYKSDNERYENYEQSLVIFNHLKNTYEALGYDLNIVPKGTIEERKAYILNKIK